ncbi:MAG: lysostaphin resistance A-like protein [Mycobacterium sp.]|nr:lysostaphin resistance A-like protein [Mycobacterium sp.]
MAPEPASASSRAPTGSATRTHRWGLGAFLLVEAVHALVAATFAGRLSGDGHIFAGTFALAVATPAVTAALLAMLITRLRGNGPRIDLSMRWSRRGLLLGLAFGAGGLVFTLPASQVYTRLMEPTGNAAVTKIFGGVRTSWPWAVTVFLVVAVVAPLCEEIVYRGLLWEAVDRRWGRWVALVATTVVFALAHFQPTRAPLLMVVALPIGLARFYSGALPASIVAHQVSNLLPGIVLMLGLAGVMHST